MQKAYSRIYWKNLPSHDTALDADNLNTVDAALDTIDDRVVTMDTTKANQTDLLNTVKTVAYNDQTGVFTFTLWNGTAITIDTDLEKLAVNFDYDDDPTSPHYQNLIITLDDGTVKYVDMSALITEYEFDNTATIAFTVSSGRITANVVDGSITGAKLQPNYLADVTAQANAASASANAAAASELNAEAWATGNKNGTPVPSTDPQHNNNAEYYAGEAANTADYVDGVKDTIEAMVNNVTFSVDFATGNLTYTDNSAYTFTVNQSTGNLEWEVSA